MKLIPLTQGKVAIVDDWDYPKLSQHKWHCSAKGYAVRNSKAAESPQHHTVWMHREILKPDIGYWTDHINGDKLDNRKANLRVCTDSQNKMNRAARPDNKHGLKGVSFKKSAKRFEAYIQTANKKVHLGYFPTALAAHAAYVKAAGIHHGQFARAL
jgi:hypothetical protein